MMKTLNSYEESKKVTNSFCSSIFGLFLGVTVLAGGASADTFEYLSFTPPRGWTNQVTPDKTVYKRPNGIGMIALYPSYPATGSASDEFVKLWRTRLESTLPGAAPQPQIQRDGDYAVALGARQFNAQGTITTVTLVSIVGKGRAIGVLSMSAGDDVLTEISAFFDSLNIGSETTRITDQNQNSAPTGGIEVDFEVPSGYVSKREGQFIVLTPTTVSKQTPCAYGISPSRPSKGSLETDASEALLEVLPGWERKEDHYNAMHGTAVEGWKYYWYRTIVQSLVGGKYQYAYAMTMAFPAGPGRVNIVWGFGDVDHCRLDDLAFTRLFHSLRPQGWTSDGGKAFARELQGTWRDTNGYGVKQYKFTDNGRYESGYGTVTTTGHLERTSSTVSDGRYELRGNEIILTPDRRDRGVSKYRVRIYDHYNKGGWLRVMSLISENENTALEYSRIEN